MSGELTLSQFRNTNTQNNDFVIGNPIPSGSSDTADRYLVFQVSDKIGPAYNPHIICEFVDSNWRIRLSDNGVTPQDFAFLNAAQTFTGTSTFSGTTNFTGTTTTRAITFGQQSSDTISFVGTPTFSNAIVFNNALTVNAPTETVTINSAAVKMLPKTILLNSGTGATGGRAGIEIDNSGTTAGYILTSSDNNSWLFKAPNKAGLVRVEASTDYGTMIIKPDGGTFGVTGAPGGVVRTFEFLNASGKVGTYSTTPSGDKVVISSITGFTESSVTATKLGYLSGVTGDIQTQLNSVSSIISSLGNSVDYIIGLTGATGSFAGFIGEVSSALYSPTGVVQSSADSIIQLKVAVGPTGALASQIQGVSAALYSATGVIQSQASAIDSLNVAVGPTGALASKISGVSAALYSATGTIQSQASSIQSLNIAVGPTGSLAQNILQLTSGLSGATASISQVMSSLNGVTATWALDANSQGHIAGIKLINGPTGSSFTINANKFQLLDNGTGTTGAPYSPFTYQNGVISLNSQVQFTSPGLATGSYLQGWQNDLDALPTGTTVIDGGRIVTHTIESDALATTLAIAGTIKSPNYTSPIPTGGVGLTAASGFKLSGTPFSTRFIGDYVNSDVQFELGTNANFGGYRVGNVANRSMTAYNRVANGSFFYNLSNWLFRPNTSATVDGNLNYIPGTAGGAAWMGVENYTGSGGCCYLLVTNAGDDGITQSVLIPPPATNQTINLKYATKLPNGYSGTPHIHCTLVNGTTGLVIILDSFTVTSTSAWTLHTLDITQWVSSGGDFLLYFSPSGEYGNAILIDGISIIA